MNPDAPANPEILYQHATARLEHGPDPALLDTLEQAVGTHPAHAGLATRYADALQLGGRLPEAIEAYHRAIDLDPTRFDPWYGLGGAHQARGAHGAARDALTRALSLDPDSHAARCALAGALFGLGEVDAAAGQFRIAIAEGAPAVRDSALASLATLIPGNAMASHNDVLATRMLWAQCAFGGIVPLPVRPPPEGRPIRVAYLSAFFGARNWMKPVFGVINCHDRQRFEIHLISDGDDPTAAAGYVAHPGDRIWQVRGMPNDELARRLAAAGIDVIVDLNGYSLQSRLGLIPHRAARRQFGWFNMFATTGVPGFDALIGDAVAILPEEEKFYSEPILRVPGSYLAFRVLYPTPPVAPPPCLAGGQITFGCLGSAYKLTPQTLEAWAAILRAAPTARLLVKNPTLDEPSNRSALLERLSALGIDADRITLSGRSEHYEFLGAYDLVDIALDTFPYNGGTTTSEALWQGVPVLTCNGDRWAGRTSRSLLLAAGLTDWVAADMDRFVTAGIRFAMDPETPALLSRLRTGLRALLAASPACDSANLCASLEAVYSEADPVTRDPVRS